MSTAMPLSLDGQVACDVMRWNDATCEAVIDVSGHLPRFSSHIDAAWVVVDEMEERGWRLHLDRLAYVRGIYLELADGEVSWEAFFGPVGAPSYELSANSACGPSAPEAICRAALAVVRGESA